MCSSDTLPAPRPVYVSSFCPLCLSVLVLRPVRPPPSHLFFSVLGSPTRRQNRSSPHIGDRVKEARSRTPPDGAGGVYTSTFRQKMEWTSRLLALSVACCCLVASSRAFQAPVRPRPTRATRRLTRGTCTSTARRPRPPGDEGHLGHRRRRRTTSLRSTTEDRRSSGGAAGGKQKAKWGQRTDADVSRFLVDFVGPDGDLVDPYKLLNVGRTASPSDIKASYRRLSRKLHPDAVARSDVLPGRW